MSIVMTGGGTGGHLAIVRAVKEALVKMHPSKSEEQDVPIIYVGSTRGQDRTWFGEDEAFAARYFLESEGVVNKRGIGKLRALLSLWRAFREARAILKKHHAKVLFSVGGYSAAPAALAALSMRVPIVIHEQNAAIGSLNKLLRPFAKAFLSSYEPQSPLKHYPVKSDFFESARVRERVETILFLGGSQGAKAINDLALALAPTLKARGITILHQAGERHLDTVQEAYRTMGIEAECFGFTDRMPELMARADLAVARAGASTLWELVANGLPTFFIPYPYAASDHQYYNAAFLVEKALAWMKREADVKPEDIVAVLDLPLETRSRELMQLASREGAEEIAELLIRAIWIPQPHHKKDL